MNEDKVYKVIAIVGPTASGKSGLAIKLAKEFNGEVINADSRQVYKYMDIGTAKDPDDDPEDNKYTVEGIVHHLIDFVEPKDSLSVAEFQQLAFQKIKEITERGQIPFLVGGTGLWVDAVCRAYEFPTGEPDEKLRKELEGKEAEELFDYLEELNPDKANSLNESDRNNPRRLIRAIEIELLPSDTCPPKRRKGDRGGYIPYNPKLKKLAQKNRKNSTRAEELLWYRMLQGKQMKGYKFLRQKPIDNFIVDFYCSELMLAVEIDGDTHPEQEKYDNQRTKKLNSFGVQVIRYNNSDILSNLEGVYDDLAKKIANRKETLPNPPLSGRELKIATLTNLPADEVGVDKGLEITPLYLSPKIDFNELEHRIYSRVEKMFEGGLIEENKKLLAMGYTYDLPSMSGIGYKEFKNYFRRDKSSLPAEEEGLAPTMEEVANEIKLRTRQYAKRQLTWFKRNKEIKYVDYDEAKKLISNFLG